MTNPTSALSPQNAFSTTLINPVTSTDTTIYLNSLPTASEGYLTIDEGLAAQEVLFFNSKGANFVTVPSLADRALQGTTTPSPVPTHLSGAVVKMKTVAQYHQALANGYGFAAAAIPNTALAANTAWTSYVPTWTAASVNPVINNGTLTGAYQQIGKTVFFRIKVIIGTTTTTGTGQWRFALPVTASAGIGTPPGSGLGSGVGTWYAENPGVIGYGGTIVTRTISDIVLNAQVAGTSGQQSQVGPSSPGVWANTWYLMASGSYEAA